MPVVIHVCYKEMFTLNVKNGKFSDVNHVLNVTNVGIINYVTNVGIIIYYLRSDEEKSQPHF